MAAILVAVRRLRKEPFVQFNDALTIVGDLEAVGIKVEPEALSLLGELLLG